MNQAEKDRLDLATASASELARVMNLGVADALEEHKRNGIPIVVWDRKTNRILTLSPEQITIPGEDPQDAEVGASGPDSEPER